MNAPLRNSLWNATQEVLPEEQDKQRHAVRAIASNIIKAPVDEVPLNGPRSWLLDRFRDMRWHQVYDMVEFIAENAIPSNLPE